jgi:hypothetical protein
MDIVKRGRKPIAVSSMELQDVLNELERAQPDGQFPNRSALWAALEQTNWAKTRSPRPLTGQVAMIIAKQNNLILETPLGKRGREKGCGPVGNPGARRRKVMPNDARIALTLVTPKALHGKVNRAANGSLKAAVALKCLDCSGGSKKEVALCAIKECSLWSFRPYKRVEGDNNADAT